jgi:serine/threonine protein kinase
MDEATLRALWSRTLGPGVTEESLSVGASYRPTVRGAPVLLPGAPVAAAAPALPARTEAGHTFEPGEVLARGGMGVIQRARQTSLGRPVALKRILPGSSDHDARERFVAEARVTARLDHPNIVPIHDLGADPDGSPFLAMKLVTGTPWSRLLHPRDDEDRSRAAGLDRDGHLAILASVGNAVACAHSRGIIHRDLKPENVMVGEFGEVLVLDWGLAAEFVDRPDAERLAEHVRTADEPAGTPSYMAPELADARGSEQGPWTDVYLLGAILHEVLTGEPPHKGKSFWSVLAAASESAPPRFPDSVPAELQAICRRALAASPADRYPTVSAFQGALQAYAKHRESLKVSSAAAAALERARSASSLRSSAETSQVYSSYAEAVALSRQAQLLWDGNESARTCEVAARSGYASAALAAGDVALARTQADAIAPDAPERRDLEARVAAAEAAKARALLVARALKGSVALLVLALIAGTAVFVQHQNAAYEKERALLGRESTLRRKAELFIDSMLNQTSQDLAQSGRSDLVEKINDRAQAYYDELAKAGVTATDELPRRRAMLALNQGIAFAGRGEPAKALEAFERSARIGREAHHDDDAATGLAQAAMVLEGQGELDRARELAREAIELGRRPAETGDVWWHGTLTHAYECLVEIELKDGHPDAAVEAARAAVAVAQRSLDAGAGDAARIATLAIAQNFLADALIAAGDVDGALGSLRAGIALYERLSLPDVAHADWCRRLVIARMRVATLLGGRGDLAGALESARKAADFLRRYHEIAPKDVGGEEQLATVLEQSASAEKTLGDRDAARKSLEEAVLIVQRLARSAGGDARYGAWLERLETALSGL